MGRNEGTTDRIVRVALGVLALGVASFAGLGPTWSWILGVVGVVLAVTGAVGFCPIYAALGLRTTKPTPKERA